MMEHATMAETVASAGAYLALLAMPMFVGALLDRRERSRKRSRRE